MTKVWIYEGRNSAAQAFWNYQDARDQQDRDNGMPLEEIIEDAENSEWMQVPDYGGSEEDGYFYIDDGGAISLVEVEGTPKPNPVEKPVLPLVEFLVHQAVRTTVDWNSRYNNGFGIKGHVINTADAGPGMNPKRRVQVEFREPVFWDFKKLWFDPDELELDV